MSYATGAAATIPALVDAICQFAITNAGFAGQGPIDIKQNSGSSTFKVQAVSKNGTMWVFRLTDNTGVSTAIRVLMCPAATLTSATRWDQLDDSLNGNYGELAPFVAPFNSYHLFTDGKEVNLAYEMSPGYWSVASFGEAATNMPGTTRLEYFTSSRFPHLPATASAWSDTDIDNFGESTTLSAIFDNYVPSSGGTAWYGSMLRLTAPGAAQWGTIGSSYVLSGTYSTARHALTYNRPSFLATSSNFTTGKEAFMTTPNTCNLRAPLAPIDLYANSRPVARIETVRLLNMQFLSPGDITNTDWMVFPLGGVKGSTGAASGFFGSRNYGVAFKKIP